MFGYYKIKTAAAATICAALIIISGCQQSGADKKAQDKGGKGPTYVELGKADKMDITDSVTSVGTLMSNESVTVSSEVAGKVTGIYFKEGQKVKAGQTLIRLDDSVLKATLDEAVVDRNLNVQKYKRAAELAKVNAVSQQDLDVAYADMQRSGASVRLAQAQLDKTNIRAPFAGTVGLRQISPGAYIQPGTAIVDLEDTSRLKLQFSIPQTEASSVRPSQKFTVTTDACPNREFGGEIYAISPKIDEAGRSMTVRGIINNSEGLLRPGVFAQIKLATGSQQEAVFVPESSISPTANGSTVYIYDNGKARQTRVSTGRRTKGYVEITDGLKYGETIIVKGQANIKDGDDVVPEGTPIKKAEK